MQRSLAAGLDTHHIAKEPQHQIYRVHRLIDQCASAVQSPSSPPARLRIIVRWTVPLYSRIRQNWLSKHTCVHRLLHAQNVGLTTILKKNSQLNVRFIGLGNEGIGPLGRDVDWFFCQHVKSAPNSGDALSGMYPRRTANRHQVHGTMIEKLVEVGVRLAAMLAAQSPDLLCVRSIDGGDLNSRNGTRGTRMRLGNVSPAYKSDIRGHLAF